MYQQPPKTVQQPHRSPQSDKLNSLDLCHERWTLVLSSFGWRWKPEHFSSGESFFLRVAYQDLKSRNHPPSPVFHPPPHWSMSSPNSSVVFQTFSLLDGAKVSFEMINCRKGEWGGSFGEECYLWKTEMLPKLLMVMIFKLLNGFFWHKLYRRFLSTYFSFWLADCPGCKTSAFQFPLFSLQTENFFTPPHAQQKKTNTE